MCILTIRACMDYLPWMKWAKWLKNALRLHICTAEQLEKGNHSAATPSSSAHLPSRSTNSTGLLWNERVGWRANFDCAHPTTKVYSNIKPVLSINTWKSSQWLTFVADREVVTIHSAPLHSAWEHIQGLFPQSLCWRKQMNAASCTASLCLEASRYDCYCQHNYRIM